MCAKNHLLIFSSFLDIWENVEWPRFFGPPGISLSFKCCPKTAKAPMKVVKDKVINVCNKCKDLQYKVMSALYVHTRIIIGV